MNKIIITIILFTLTLSLIIGVIIPIMAQIKSTGQNSFSSVKNLNDNIKPSP